MRGLGPEAATQSCVGIVHGAARVARSEQSSRSVKNSTIKIESGRRKPVLSTVAIEGSGARLRAAKTTVQPRSPSGTRQRSAGEPKSMPLCALRLRLPVARSIAGRTFERDEAGSTVGR